MSSHGGQLENDGVDDEEGFDHEQPPAFVAPHHPRIDHSVFYNAVFYNELSLAHITP